MDQDETWHAGRPRPWPYCDRRIPSFPPQKGDGEPLQFSAHIYCGHMARWIKIPRGREVGLISPSDIVLDVDPAPLPKKGGAPNFRPISVVAK